MGFFASSGILNRRGFFGGTTAAPFSPSDISGLQLWLDATTGLFDATSGGSAVTTDGSAVARWEDQSGSGYHVTQGTSNNRPILKTSIRNSKNIIRFDGSNDLLVSASIASDNLSAMTCFVVAYVAGYGGGTFGRYFERGSINRAWSVNQNEQTNRLFTINTTFFHDTATGSITTGNWYLSSAKWDGGTDRATNMSQRINEADSTRGLTGTGTTSSVANTTYQIGNRTAADRAFNGDIAELIIYNVSLSASEITSVEDYLADKWGF
jgi:hypothetical protein